MINSDEFRERVGNRIQEILDENKKVQRNPTSIRELSKALGHRSKNRVESIIHGKYLSNLSIEDYEKITITLGITMDQLLESDVCDVQRSIKQIIHNGDDPKIALEILEDRILNALGVSEKHFWYLEKGYVLVSLSRYKEAIDVYEKAWELAKQIKYQGEEAIHRTLVQLAFCYYRVEHYDKFLSFLEDVQTQTQNPKTLGRIFYQRGLYSMQVENDEPIMMMWFNRALMIFQNLEDQGSIGRVYHAMAEFYFHKEDFEKSLEYHHKARILIPTVDSYETQLQSDKDYAKTLYCSGSIEEAKNLISIRLQDESINFYPIYLAKFLLLYAEITGDKEAMMKIFALELDEKNRHWQTVASDMYCSNLIETTGDKIGIIAYSKVRASSPELTRKFYKERSF